MQNYLVGIDEVGRGPLAGPVAVGVAIVREGFDFSLLPKINDSKKLSSKIREEIFELATDLKNKRELDFYVSLVSPKVIDRRGITNAISLAMDRALVKVESTQLTTQTRLAGRRVSGSLHIKLDGGLKAPHRFTSQETITKGDQLEPVIGLASIVAKVKRDRFMDKKALQTQYNNYGFENHKGYGTKQHQDAILRYGLTDMHRQSFCRKYL